MSECGLRFPGLVCLLLGRELERRDGLGEVVELLFAFVRARALQCFDIGARVLECLLGLVEALLGCCPRLTAAGLGERRLVHGGNTSGDRCEAGADLFDLSARLLTQVLGVDPDETLGCLIGGREPLERAADFLHVAERTRSFEDQLIVEWTETVGECLRKALRVEVLRELGAAKRENEIDQLVVALHTETEHSRVDGCAVVEGTVGDGIAAELFGQLLLGERTIVVADQREVDSDAAVGDEVPAGDLVVGAGCAHADAHGHRLGIFEGAAAELHPHVGVRAVLTPVEQVGLHRALFTGERVEAPRFDAAVEDEREQDLEGLGLAGSVGSPQNQSTVGERELLVSVIPEVDDSSPSRSEAGVAHTFSTSDSSPLGEGSGPNSSTGSGAELSTAKSI